MITDTAVDSSFQPRFEQVVLGDVVVRSTQLDKDLAEELLACSRDIPDFPTLIGHTMCTYDFYEGNTFCLSCLTTRHAKSFHSSMGKAIQGARGPGGLQAETHVVLGKARQGRGHPQNTQ